MITGLHVVLLRVSDVEREREFYQGVFGLDLVHEGRPGAVYQLRIPGSGAIEIIAGGQALPAPNDRVQSPTTPVFDVDNVDTSLERAVAAGASVVNAPWHLATGVRIAYLADPEGHVFGIRHDPDA